MIKRFNLRNIALKILAVCFCLTASHMVLSAPKSGEKLDPKFYYFYQGEYTGGRLFSVGDPGDWAIPVTSKSAVSKKSKVKVSPISYKGESVAIRAEFDKKKKMRGQLALYGYPVDLSGARDIGALTFDVMVHKKPNKDVKLAMDCNYPCRAEVSIRKLLRQYPQDEWTPFFVPLNCFKSDNFDLSDINGVFVLSTEGELEISVANLRLERLPESEKGCSD